MPGVGIGEPARARVDHAIEQAQEHFGAPELLGERLPDPLQHFGRPLSCLRVDPRGGHHERHDQCGPEPVARDVADDDADAVVREVQQVVKVPSHRFRLAAAGRHVHAGRDDER